MRESLPLLREDPKRPLPRLGQEFGFLRNELEGSIDVGQGRAELVRNEGHEVGLHPVELTELVVRLAQLLVPVRELLGGGLEVRRPLSHDRLEVTVDRTESIGSRLELDDQPSTQVRTMATTTGPTTPKRSTSP